MVFDVDERLAPGTVGFMVWRLSMAWRVEVDRAVADLGLTHAKYALLASLYGLDRSGHQPTQKELADHTGLEPLYVSKLARSLQTAGHVDRTPDPVDARAVRLHLTGDGREVAKRAVAIVAQLLDTLTAPLGGTGSKRTSAFVRDLGLLLDAPRPSQTQGDQP
jgi:MarR family transcriptional regulator, organic hydroperoxide resistance regulator